MFNNIDAPGQRNRQERRAVAAVQRAKGSTARQEAAKAKRQRKMAAQFERELKRTIVFFNMPKGGVDIATPDGAYLWGGTAAVGGSYQCVVVGPLKSTVDHYVKAIGIFLKGLGKGPNWRMVVAEPMPLVKSNATADEIKAFNDRGFLSIIVEPVA